MKRVCIGILLGMGLLLPCLAQAQANLENPAQGSFQSGIGVISGWKCTAGTITITTDNGPPAQAAYGTSRADTQVVCGKTNTGFGLLFNWNRLGDGQHTLRAFDNGVQFASATFTVTTLGQEFLTGAFGAGPVFSFPQGNVGTTVQWEESLQNFVIVRRQPCSATKMGTAMDGFGGSATFTVTTYCGASGVVLALKAISAFNAVSCSPSGCLDFMQDGMTLNNFFWLDGTTPGVTKDVHETVPAGMTRYTVVLFSPGVPFNPAAPFSVLYNDQVVVKFP